MKNILVASLLLGVAASAAQAGSSLYERADEAARAGRLAEALALLQASQADKPLEQTLPSELALRVYLLADNRQLAQALEFAQLALGAHPRAARLWLARAYAHRQGAQHAQALAAYQQALTLEPGNADASLGVIYSLKETGGALLAFKQAQQHPGVLSDAALQTLRHDAAVQLLRAARGDSSAQRRQGALDEAIALMQAHRQPSTAQQSDLLVALALRGQHEQAVQLYRQLRRASTDAPAPWARAAAAASLLQRGHVDEGLELLEQAHALEPENLEAAYTLMFAYSDAKRFVSAMALCDALVERLRLKAPSDLPYALQMQAQLRLWAGQTAQASALADQALAAYPTHEGLNLLQVRVLLARGRVHEARAKLDSLTQAAVPGSEAHLLALELDAPARPREVAESVRKLREQYPQDPRIERAAQELERAQKPYVWAAAGSQQDRDSSTTSHTLEVGSGALGPAGTRVYAQRESRRESLRDAAFTSTTTALGVQQVVGSSVQASAAVVHTQPVASAPSGTGLRVKTDFDFGSLGRLSWQWTSLDTQIAARAVLEGITAKSHALQWSTAFLDDKVRAGVRVARQSLSDGNDRDSVSASLRMPLTATDRWRWESALNAGLDRASTAEVSYFSPRSAWWGDAELSAQSAPWSLGPSTRVSLKPTLALGVYAQEGLSVLPTASAGLSVNMDVGSSVSFSLEMRSTHRPYDAQYTTLNSAQLSMFARLP